MSIQERARITDFKIAQEVGNSIVIGNCFAFVKQDLFQNAKMSWLKKLLGPKPVAETSILSLMDCPHTEMFGAAISPVSLGNLELWSITSDKSVYKADEDTVELLLVNPIRASLELKVQIIRNNLPYSTRTVRIGKHGEAKITLQDLPAGDYAVFFEGCSDASRYCRFTVAQYKLVPLVAQLKGKMMDKEGSLQMQVELTSFGVPVNGDVKIRVSEEDILRATLTATVYDGACSFGVKMEGQGALTLFFQMVDEPGKTANLPIIGSRAVERSLTLFNALGCEIFGSLLPSEDATEVRGIYLTEGGITSTPVRLDYDEEKHAVLKASSEIKSLKVCRVDPTFPHPRAGAVNPKEHHPSLNDVEYNSALKLFQVGDYKESLDQFRYARSKQANPHPYYAYFAACCLAKLGDIDAAIDELRLSIFDGWNEFEHMANDEDLSSLRADARFIHLTSGGLTEFEFKNLSADQEIQIPFLHGLTILLIGAVLGSDQIWEGWTSHVSTPLISVGIECSARQKAGESTELKLQLKNNSSSAAVYVLVKDARLVSAERPDARLAMSIKGYVEEHSKLLSNGYCSETLESVARFRFPHRTIAADEGGWGSPIPNAEQEQISTGGWGVPRAGLPQNLLNGSARPAPLPGGSVNQQVRSRMFAAEPAERSYEARAAASMETIATEAPSIPIRKGAEPEVLFADFVRFESNEATVELFLPLQESDYVVECFAIADFDWCFSETRFRAVSDPLAEFTLPRFVSAGEFAQSWLHLGSRSNEFTCELRRDGEIVPLKLKNANFPAEQMISEELLNLEFPAGPGHYSAVLRASNNNILARIEQIVDEPGKLKRRTRGVRFLKPGESVSLKDEDSVVSMRILPGLEKKFKKMLEATCDYSHCCCEQTAAKILSACNAYVFAGDDELAKSRAEASIIVGIKREEQMWLPGRGFKMYPEATNYPDPYLGKMAAQHLINLELLGPFSNSLSADLKQSIELGLKMAKDVLRAQNEVYPPARIASIRDAYLVMRSSSNVHDNSAVRALDYVKSAVPTADAFLSSVGPCGVMGFAVNLRMQAAYAAATLIRERGPMVNEAIKLANFVVKAINDEGRLYSTTDSAAAIALFSELAVAGMISNSGTGTKVEVNGTTIDLSEAILKFEEVSSVKCLEGLIAVEVEKEIIEDWSVFDSKLALRVALEKAGAPARNFKLGEQVDLKVTLADGYQNGDLLWVCLPDSLSRIYGGAQIKMFSVDFCGKSELTIPLAVTGKTMNSKGEKSQQKMALCVRNMFNEERGGNPGLIGITAT